MSKSAVIQQTALQLFSQQGWKRVSVDEICQQAKVSRVTFYKHFKNKKALLKQLLFEQKEEVRLRFLDFLKQEISLETIISQIFKMQEEALNGLYSQPMQADFQYHSDEEIRSFFTTMEQEKYRFMSHFFQQLQTKRIIQQDFPIALISVFTRKIDELRTDPQLCNLYRGKEHQLNIDALQLMMYGLAYKKEK
ncbi:TetR/AcrR family transcriptional regulator [Testudinibacter sp. TR-2022]|uniref:TetR/AcrR family transcriptional regulator n=2 Tax=Testudinibacter sp. TR-2022 TaxID=2585029 RepID=UPI00111A8466|nr:TetR/AcrR family transcriptional regulator [Testudinibacter sp. TR-2022]TNH03725.1 TetR/AcrR family transcriptional regulator [Testudinibacter sp. TR-2022]TNH04667.1 TetR/AcrR family transcriptional regulator [Pasteurellaceae bacterium Phil31]TNH15554.1 TetR/AcrR family transcriptional regulator [Testudinibacter sp. TR-2022]TNH17075.1 TetR/AcrR family transcriptional regulator [Testudinibacter sp. TR-2022]